MQRRSYSSLSAPPVVPPPLPNEISPARPGHVDGGSSRRHLLRDLSIGSICLLVGLIVGSVGWLSANGSPTRGVELLMQQPQLAQLTDVSLSSQPTQAALARRDSQADNADEGVAEVAGPTVSPPTLEFAALSAQQDASAARQTAHPSFDGVSPSEPEAIATRQGIAHTPGDRAEPGHENLAELLWGRPRSLQPESLQEFESPSSLLHATAEHETCSESPMLALGTALNWADKPEDAYRIAAEQDKLVFLIHVSGNFEIPGYT